ncbi:DciA family protein [Streptomyces sp. NPDC060001]|uniref:DciA family protein n=1 Tax=Streptomyces sp. NPDC060001 TaxID=3347032 RepID=UPI00369C87A8
MTDTPQLSGSDLARQALANARKAARANPTPGPARRRTPTLTRHRSGRDPITLATAITNLGADLTLTEGIAGGTVIDQWPSLCPQYADTVQPISYDEHTGRLDLRPASHAYAAQLRLLGGQLAKQINDKMGRTVVRTIRVLPVGNLTARTPAADEPETAAPGPVKTRETASPGYRTALETALTHRPDREPTNPYVLQAIARQEKALRAGRPPETEHTEAVWEQDRLEQEERRRAEAVRKAAIARARSEGPKGPSGQIPARIFGAA